MSCEKYLYEYFEYFPIKKYWQYIGSLMYKYLQHLKEPAKVNKSAKFPMFIFYTKKLLNKYITRNDADLLN